MEQRRKMPEDPEETRLSLISLVERAFRDVSMPTAANLSASVGEEAYEEANAFRGKKWQDLDPEFISRYSDALFWFTPDAFHYYLPAFLKASLVRKDVGAIYVSSILHLLEPATNQTLSGFRKERWSRLTDAQRRALEEWLRWLLRECIPGGVLEEEVEGALGVVRDTAWYYW